MKNFCCLKWKFLLFPFVILVFLIISCSKDADIIPPNEEVEIWENNRPGQYALNVVFFTPTDFITDNTKIEKVNRVMLFVQLWFEKQMELQGFGKKTFGLITNQHNKVRIIRVNGKESSAFYKEDNSQVRKEVKAFLELNPELKKSEHTFILGDDESGVPFYGIGKYAHATSDDFKLVSSGKYLDGLELMNCDKLGGIMHELTHALNVPHFAHKGSVLPNISLMSFGNHTYQSGKTDQVFLTKSTCAILNVCQVFNTIGEIDYYSESTEAEMGEFQILKDESKNQMVAEGVFTSSVNASYLYIGHNGYPEDDSSNPAYDEVTFTVPVLQTKNENEYSFYLEMPYSDLFNDYKTKEKDSLELKVVAVLKNGNKATLWSYDYTMDISSKTPNNNVNIEYKPHIFSDRSNWGITTNTFSGENIAENMIDGKRSTYWHSKWPYLISEKGNHEININMNSQKQFGGLYFLSKRDGGQFRPKHLIIKTSVDGSSWNSKEFTISSRKDAAEFHLHFEKTISVQYLRVIIDQVFSDNDKDNLLISEVDIL